MPTLQLKYRHNLGYPGADVLPRIPSQRLEALDKSCVLTFRRPERGRPGQVIQNVSAVTRVRAAADATDITFYGIEADSPLAPLIIWDVVHHAPIGAVFRFIDGLVGERLLDRPYYSNGVGRIDERPGEVTFRKTAALDAEAGQLDSWTFGIPVGPEDATLLNACVARILELEIPNREILLCGRPNENFKYWDEVRIIGEDITAPPIQICRKKNRIAQEARYENLCIIHDRVFLPRNFVAATSRFGNAFPFTALQSLYFDDRWNLTVRRYSDFGVGLRLAQHKLQALARHTEVQPSRYAQATLTSIEKTGFVHGNGYRHHPNNYLTGSLYLVKRSVWRACPQDERLLWVEFEDIEQGERASKAGIPSRINPYGFTQSMISRPILSWLGTSWCETRRGGERQFRSAFEAYAWLPRKPLIKKTEEQAVQDYNRFLKDWGMPRDLPMEPTTAAITAMRRRLRWIVQAVSAAQLPLHKDTITKFLKDFEKLVVSEQVPYAWHEQTAAEFVNGGAAGLNRFFETCYELFNHAAQRKHRGIFAKSLLDYMPRRGIGVIVGSLITATALQFASRQQFVLEGGVGWTLKAILGSTPFIDYAVREAPAHGA